MRLRFSIKINANREDAVVVVTAAAVAPQYNAFILQALI
jgi:hypothetical protein